MKTFLIFDKIDPEIAVGLTFAKTAFGALDQAKDVGYRSPMIQAANELEFGMKAAGMLQRGFGKINLTTGRAQ